MEKLKGKGMKIDEIVKIVEEVVDEVKKKYKARVKGIFGSFVKGEEHEGSDVDILVEFKEGASLLDFVGLSYFLEEKLTIPVDIVPIDTLRLEIKDNILKEAIYL